MGQPLLEFRLEKMLFKTFHLLLISRNIIFIIVSFSIHTFTVPSPITDSQKQTNRFDTDHPMEAVSHPPHCRHFFITGRALCQFYPLPRLSTRIETPWRDAFACLPLLFNWLNSIVSILILIIQFYEPLQLEFLSSPLKKFVLQNRVCAFHQGNK